MENSITLGYEHRSARHAFIYNYTVNFFYFFFYYYNQIILLYLLLKYVPYQCTWQPLVYIDATDKRHFKIYWRPAPSSQGYLRNHVFFKNVFAKLTTCFILFFTEIYVLKLIRCVHATVVI